jgi:hypothetical protein
MDKWLARLQALEEPEFAVGLYPAHCHNRQKGLVSALAGAAPADSVEVGVTPDDVARHRLEARRARLLRWGMPWQEAAALALRLAARDAHLDDRVTCAGDCGHYRAGRCGNHRRAGLDAPAVGRDLAALLQRCPGVRRWDRLDGAAAGAERGAAGDSTPNQT